jgi:hypothetical protein
MQIAVVATARKLAVFCRHLVVKGEDYAFQRPSLTEKKLRARVSVPPCPLFHPCSVSPAGTGVSRAGKTSSGVGHGVEEANGVRAMASPPRRWPAGPSACTRSLPMTAWHT